MSLFDEFDRLTPNPDKDKRDTRDAKDASAPVPLRDPLASRIPPERKPEPGMAAGPMTPPIGAPESAMIRPVESIRFSLSRGAVAAIFVGSVVAAALLYGGGYLTAYVVYQPGTERQAEQKHPEPPPLVDTDRPHSKSAKAGDGKRAADPLKVVMSPKTSGGRAVVAPQSEVPETQPSAAPVEPPVARAPITSPAQAKPPAKSVTPPPPVAAPTVPVVAAPPASNPEKLLDTPKAKADTVSAPLPPAPGGLATVAPPPPPVSAKKPTTQATPAVPLKPKSEADEAARLATTNTSENPVKSAFSGSVGYTVQLGAFSSEANANGLLKKLGGDIGNLRVEKGVTPSGRTLFYLRAGYFGKRSEASELAARLKADEKIKAGYVMRVKAPAATP